MLDVGQGLAMVIERHGKAILYDTGLAWPGGDSGQQLIIPATLASSEAGRGDPEP